MNVKTLKIVHWIFTGLVSALLLMSVTMYLTKSDEIKAVIVELGFPSWLFYHLIFAKLSGVAFILVRKWPKLTEWAYAGLTFEFCLALSAHAYKEDGEHIGAVMALVLLMGSYATKRLLENKK